MPKFRVSQLEFPFCLPQMDLIKYWVGPAVRWAMPAVDRPRPPPGAPGLWITPLVHDRDAIDIA